MDRDIADRMRSENVEQFQTLVRMHLSFELDLNTDTADTEAVLNVKTKPKKRFNFPKKLKYVTTSKASNVPFNVAQVLSSHGIQQIRNIITFLMLEENILQEGIFRRTGSVARQHDLRRRINENKELKLDEGIYTVHDCASVLKGILADLPEPLLADSFYAVHCQIAELCNSADATSNRTKETRLLHSIQLLLLLLPFENRSLFHDIINMLHETTKHEHSNKMSAESLATLFSPHLICPRKLAPEALHAVSQSMSGLISFMITKGTELQDVPTKLATDIRAYFVEQRRRRVLSPEMQMLDVSVTSDSVANTVFTFIDREKTAEAHVSNPTDTALAQLYAYIQTLPESSKKRKLVKQFNKENGQGTPLQTQMLLRLKKNETARGGYGNSGGRSFSGSLKKHIFHNTLSKTPKRCSTTPITNANTPTNSRLLDDASKPRSVFQSPIYETRVKKPKTESCQTPIPSTTPLRSNAADQSISANLIEMDTTDDSSATIIDDDKENEHSDSSSTPLTKECVKPFNKNNMKTFYKSEPNLSKIIGDKNSTPILNRGKYIAKKLFNSVSMNNLRRPFAQSHDRSEATDAKRMHGMAADTPKASLMDNDECVTPSHGEEKEPKLKFIVENSNVLMSDECDSKDSAAIEEPGFTVDSMERESESPITKSTHRMSKAMQESIMTPRSRKPVIIGAMLGLSNENYRKNFLSLPEVDDELLNRSKDLSPINASLYKSKSESDLLDLKSANEEGILGSAVDKDTPDETLSTPFRQYLISRSLLTTTPVDSSFSSQSDDFENLNDSEMSESLIYCLNGNEPIYLSPQNTGDMNATLSEFGSCRKRLADCGGDNFYRDYTNSQAKKTHTELDETAL